MSRVEIYTDGACLGNPGPGGWGALVTYEGKTTELSGAHPDTTNNRMELMAAIKALAFLPKGSMVDLYTDSQYVQKGIQQWLPNWKRRGWKNYAGKEVKNKDLWEKLDKEVVGHQVQWHWVKGHAGCPGNERADTLANTAATLQEE